MFLCDTGEPDHLAAEAVHGMLSRDGTPPSELRRLEAEELRRYPSVSVSQAKVEVVDRADDGRFTAKVEAAGSVETRRVLLAYGIRNSLPNLEGIEELWGQIGRRLSFLPWLGGARGRDRRIAAKKQPWRWS